MNTIASALRCAQAQGLSRIDAQMLALFALGQNPNDRAWLLTHDSEHWPLQTHARFEQLVEQRMDTVPVAYLLGTKAFFGIDLKVDARVLDPRDDTEALVEWALERAVAAIEKEQQARILDLGTGSGAIALALAKCLGQTAQIVATDVSLAALEVARANAAQLCLNVQFAHGSWFDAVRHAPEEFHVIASNPPYIESCDPHLAALKHEPIKALASGADGLDAIRTIVAGAPAHLTPSGWLLLEHGHDQSKQVRALLMTSGFTDVQSRCDLAGIERCSGGRLAKHHR